MVPRAHSPCIGAPGATLVSGKARLVVDLKSELKRIRPLDLALVVVAVAVVVLGAYLGWSVWAHNQQVVSSTPANRAVEAIKADLRKDPNNLDLRMQLAQALLVAQRRDEAVQQYTAVLKASKDYVPALAGLGFVAMREKDWKTGEKYYTKVVELLANTEYAGRNRTLETAYFYLGTALMEQKKYEEAVGYFKEALRIRRDASDTHYALAVTYKNLDSMSKYRDELEAAVAFDPKMPEANYDLALILIDEGEVGRAAELLRTSIDNAPGVDEPQVALDELGPFEKRFAAAKKLGVADLQNALEEARVAAALEPTNIDALKLLGSLWESSGDLDNAQSAYDRILAIDPQDAEAKASVERLANAQ